MGSLNIQVHDSVLSECNQQFRPLSPSHVSVNNIPRSSHHGSPAMYASRHIFQIQESSHFQTFWITNKPESKVFSTAYWLFVLIFKESLLCHVLTFIQLQAYLLYLLGSETASLSGQELTNSEGIGSRSILSVYISGSAVFASFCVASL